MFSSSSHSFLLGMCPLTKYDTKYWGSNFILKGFNWFSFLYIYCLLTVGWNRSTRRKPIGEQGGTYRHHPGINVPDLISLSLGSLAWKALRTTAVNRRMFWVQWNSRGHLLLLAHLVLQCSDFLCGGHAGVFPQCWASQAALCFFFLRSVLLDFQVLPRRDLPCSEAPFLCPDTCLAWRSMCTRSCCWRVAFICVSAAMSVSYLSWMSLYPSLTSYFCWSSLYAQVSLTLLKPHPLILPHLFSQPSFYFLQLFAKLDIKSVLLKNYGSFFLA